MYYESIGDYMAGLVGTEVGDKCFTTFDLQRNIQVQRVSVFFAKVEIQFHKMQMFLLTHKGARNVKTFRKSKSANVWI